MKKLLTFVLSLSLLLSLSVPAFAEEKKDEKKIDLSGLSYEELVALKDEINLAMWQCDEWQEVEVPQGVWKVGDDIPAGHWTIKALSKGHTMVSVGDKTRNGGADVQSKTHETIVDIEYKNYKEGSDSTEWSIELKDGEYVQVDFGTAVFTPYAGKPSLGFKK